MELVELSKESAVGDSDSEVDETAKRKSADKMTGERKEGQKEGKEEKMGGGGEVEEEDRKPTSFCGKLYLKLLQKVEDAGGEGLGGVEVSDLREKGLAIPLLTLYGIIWMGSLVYFTYAITVANVNQKFLSMDFTNDDSTICAEVPLPSTGSFQVDQFGNWQTQSDFNFNSSVFALDMLGTTLSNADYATLMQSFSDKVKALGSKAVSRSVAWNWVVRSACH